MLVYVPGLRQGLLQSHRVTDRLAERGNRTVTNMAPLFLSLLLICQKHGSPVSSIIVLVNQNLYLFICCDPGFNHQSLQLSVESQTKQNWGEPHHPDTRPLNTRRPQDKFTMTTKRRAVRRWIFIFCSACGCTEVRVRMETSLDGTFR